MFVEQAARHAHEVGVGFEPTKLITEKSTEPHRRTRIYDTGGSNAMLGYVKQTDKLRAKAGWKDKSFYEAWQESEGLPIITGPYVEDVRKVPRKPWRRVGGKGAFINLADQQEVDAQVLEIAPGEQLNFQKHIYENWVFVLEGNGQTEFVQKGGKGVAVEWKKGSLFAPPLNVSYRHSNASRDESAILFSVTYLPFYLNNFRNLDFVFDNNFAFTERFPVRGNQKYFLRKELVKTPLEREVNFIENILKVELGDLKIKGKGSTLAYLSMSDGSLGGHITQIPMGAYVKAHRHGPGAHVLTVQGEGYELLWYQGEKRRRYELHEGSLVSPRAWEYHQHFNAGKVELKQLALGYYAHKYKFREQYEGSWITEIVDYDREDPMIRDEFENELQSKGITNILQV